MNIAPARLLVASSWILLALAGCSEGPAAAAPGGAASSTQAAAAASPGGATVGQPAPAFTLKDLEGKEVSLASLKGKIVVLEWFNPGCPFVQKSHGKGSLKGFAKQAVEKGAVWLSINSGAPGKQGAGLETNQKGAKDLGVENPILLDEDGKVGRAYGATNTPHVFVVDAQGVLAYAGAIDNSPDGEGESPQGGKLVNYADQALGELLAGKPVSVPTTKAYGCSVKYGS